MAERSCTRFAAAIACALLITAARLAPASLDEIVRTPAFAPDGRLAIAATDDLWVLQPAGDGAWGAAERITTGPSWDRDPAWSHDGRTLVFASDRAGTIDLWQVAATGGEPVRLTASPEHDGEPSVRADGAIVFVRGTGGDADLWLRDGAGERRLTFESGAERSPAWSPDGQRIAYIAVRSGRRELRVRTPDVLDETLLPEYLAQHPAWSPDGERIVFGGGAGRAGVWTVERSGRSARRVGTEPGVPAWSPDGRWVVVADPDPGEPTYNGEPDRLGERAAGDLFGTSAALRRYPARGRGAGEPLSVDLPVARAARHADAYDRVWSRVARLYYGHAGGDSALLGEWRAAGERHRARAVAAETADDLRAAIWAVVRERPQRQPARGRAAVSSAHPLASAAGIEILELGGNVVDAAVAVSFALGVVEPDASGIGGYGTMLIHRPGMESPTAIEFHSRVPVAAGIGSGGGEAIPASGAGVANVPGTVAGMELAWRRYGSGRIAWARLLEPAIRLARDGFPTGEGMATTLRRQAEGFAVHESSRTLFFPGGRPLRAGDTLRNADLAATLGEIARGGAEAFYRGPVGERMIADLRRGGSRMTMTDLASYTAVERRPVHTTYRGNDVFAAPPPASGGAALVAALNLLEQAAAGGRVTEDAARLHALLEALKFQASASIADPDLWPVDVSAVESKDTARARWRCFDPARAGNAADLAGADCGRTVETEAGRAPATHIGEWLAAARAPAAGPGAAPTAARTEPSSETCLEHDRTCSGTGTTAVAIADAEGNMVSVTQTLGRWGGNFYVSPGLGFLYNDKLGSYSGNRAGRNARVAYARNTTSIAPTLVFRGSGGERRPWLALGAAGNAWIGAAVYVMVAEMVDHDLNPQQALELPRFLTGTRVQLEDGFSPAVMRELERMGHSFTRTTHMGELRMGYGAAVRVADGFAEAGGDPRRSGSGQAVR